MVDEGGGVPAGGGSVGGSAEAVALARLVRFYPGLDPERVFTLPAWVLEILVEQMDRLDAEDMQKAMIAASAPYMQEHDRRALFRRLNSLSARLQRPEPPVVTEIDAAKAREWFETLGIKVQ